MNWPWTSRARLDDALVLVSEQKARIAVLEGEVRKLADRIIQGHGGTPAFAIPVKNSAIPVAPTPPVDVMQLEAPTVINEVKKNGARSAREICAGIEKGLTQRHQERMKVARELEAVMSQPAAGNGTH